MTFGRSSSLAAALLCGALIAGCGSSSSTSSGSTATAATTTKTTTSTAAKSAAPATQSTSSTATAVPKSSAAGVSQYVALCKAIVARDSKLAANAKSKIEGICNKAANGNLAGARAAAKEVCVEIINASPIPAADKTKALAACKAS